MYESGHRNEIQVVAINELADIEAVTHLTMFDSTHGRFRGEVSSREDRIIVNGDEIRVLREPEIANLPWKTLGVDVVLECTGKFKSRSSAEEHIRSGAGRVIFSQPADPEMDATIVYGINEKTLKPTDRIVSNASCTTNCIIPVIDVIDKACGIESGAVTTIHSAMNDQQVIDAYHKNLRLTRAAGHSIIPVDTALAKGIERILPRFDGCFEAISVRVPTINVTAIDLSVTVTRSVSIEDVNMVLKEAAGSYLKGILDYVERPLVSVDFNHDPHSSIVDGTQTRVSRSNLVKVLCWCDNEWGFANRMLDTLQALVRA